MSESEIAAWLNRAAEEVDADSVSLSGHVERHPATRRTVRLDADLRIELHGDRVAEWMALREKGAPISIAGTPWMVETIATRADYHRETMATEVDLRMAPRAP